MLKWFSRAKLKELAKTSVKWFIIIHFIKGTLTTVFIWVPALYWYLEL